MKRDPITGRDPLAGRIPIILITGFLGSGKTTLLGKLLRHPGMDRAAVIINELGDVAIDHQLLATSSEQMTLLGNGCLCCTVRTDLQETLREMFIKRRAGEVSRSLMVWPLVAFKSCCFGSWCARELTGA